MMAYPYMMTEVSAGKRYSSPSLHFSSQLLLGFPERIPYNSHLLTCLTAAKAYGEKSQKNTRSALVLTSKTKQNEADR
jgi:hypothetical protein